MTTRKRSGALRLIALGLGIAAFSAVFMFSCETDNAVVNLALKKEGKVYVFSTLGSFIVENSIRKNESPAAFGFIQLFEDDGLFGLLYGSQIHA